MITNLKMNGKNYMIILIVQKIKLKINDITILYILKKPCFLFIYILKIYIFKIYTSFTDIKLKKLVKY